MTKTDWIAAMQHRRAAALLVFSALLALAGCAATGPESPAEAVAERAQARWEALLAKDYKKAYTYYSPGYRSAEPLAAFQRRLSIQRVRWTKAEYQGVECQGQVCHPSFRVTYKYRAPVQGVGTITSARKITEDWVLTDGRWYYVPPQGEGLR